MCSKESMQRLIEEKNIDCNNAHHKPMQAQRGGTPKWVTGDLRKSEKEVQSNFTSNELKPWKFKCQILGSKTSVGLKEYHSSITNALSLTSIILRTFGNSLTKLVENH